MRLAWVAVLILGALVSGSSAAQAELPAAEAFVID